MKKTFKKNMVCLQKKTHCNFIELFNALYHAAKILLRKIDICNRTCLKTQYKINVCVRNINFTVYF